MKTLFILILLSGFSLSARSQAKMLSGSVVDENGEGMIGVFITSADGKRGVMTDEKGQFFFELKPSDKTLTASFLGYQTQTINIEGKATLKISMQPEKDNSLDEVVVIGYGEVKKSDLTGSVFNVKLSDVKESSGLSVGQALQGRIAGVDVMSTSGAPGESTSIRIRGTRSVTATNEPLIIVDGVMDVVKDLSMINPEDIESISMLKDASATAIYGSQGANGVIMVKTKAGSTAKPRINLSAEAGVSQIARKLDIMNASEFMRYYNDYRYFRSGQNSGEPLRYDPYSYGPGTDWQEAITRIAPYQNYNFSIGGKQDKIDYFASINYVDNQGIIKDSYERRITARLNVGYQILKWLKLSYRGNYTFRRTGANKANIGGTNLSNGAIYLSPIIGLYDEFNPLYENGTRIDTPLTSIERKTSFADRHDFINTLILDIQPVKGLVISSKNTYKVFQRHDYQLLPNTLTSRLPEQGSRAYRYESDHIRVLSDNTVTYKHDFPGGHHIDALAGFSLSYVWANTASITADGIVSDDLKWYNLNAIASKENYTINSSNTETTKLSWLARFNYNYGGRYYLTLTGRYDGSSNFAAHQKWGFFPSAALKWAAKKEQFLKKVSWLNELSVRTSIGLTGNDGISAYRSLESYNTNTAAYVFDGTQPMAAYISRLANPDLTWEKTMMVNGGVDMAFLKNRIKVIFDGYYSRTTDLLLNVQTATATGYTSRLQNLGCTTNAGFELTLETRNIQLRDFQWQTSFTISHNEQMVRDVGNEEYVVALSSAGNNSYMMYGYKAGYPLNAMWGFQYAGPWHSNEEIQRNKYTHTYASVLTAAPGIPRYVDQNGDGIISQDDLCYLGQSDPWLYGGLQNTFNYKDWKFSIFLTYSIGGKIYNFSEMYMAGGNSCNQYRYMLDAWHPVRNPDSWYPRAGTDDAFVPSTLMLHDASYLRLKTVSISRDIFFRKTKVLKGMTITLKGDNLWLWTEYNGFDPDVSTENDGSVLRRVDKGAYPKARRYTLGIKLNF
ncbi:MAG: TonB-dependent receptor [Bacteroidales bacterium]|nr:TonB-dependent receptor [Bacteroidales bacterium]